MKLKRKLYIKISDLIVCIFLLVFVMVLFIFYLLNKYATPILLDYALVETTKLSTLIINKAVENKNNNFDVNDIVNTILNKDGEIISVDFNTHYINESLVSINNTIQTNLKYLEEGKLDLIGINDTSYKISKLGSGIIYQIPFGVISNCPLISDIGPKIPVKTTLIGSVFSNVRSDITPYGINNALLKVYIEVTVTEQVILPFLSKRIDISLEIPILIKLINGRVPSVYGGMYSVDSPLTKSE